MAPEIHTADVTADVTADTADIFIPEATPVLEGDGIPEATVIRPEKYSVTVAGRKVPLYQVVLGISVTLGVMIALSLTLPRNGDDAQVMGDEASLPGYCNW